MRPLALDDQGIEGREDVRELETALACIRQRRRGRPMLLFAGALERDRNQLPKPHPRFGQPPYPRLAQRVEMTDRSRAQRLATQAAVEQMTPISAVEAALGGWFHPKCRCIRS
jgi:hypothetical protein